MPGPTLQVITDYQTCSKSLKKGLCIFVKAFKLNSWDILDKVMLGFAILKAAVISLRTETKKIIQRKQLCVLRFLIQSLFPLDKPEALWLV